MDMANRKRRSLKSILLSEVIVAAVLVIVIITVVSSTLQSERIIELTQSVLAEESKSYSSEIYNWWSGVETRVKQTADVWKSIPDMSYDDALSMLLVLTEKDPDSQDIYVGYGESMTFLDGSGWDPPETFVFTDRVWYTGALSAGGEIYTSEPYLDASTGKTCLACAIMLDDGVVLSSDINFDKVAEKLNAFQSSAQNAGFYIINKETQDILVSNESGVVGETVSESGDQVMQGLKKVFSSLQTLPDADDKVVTASTPAGKMLYVATDIQDTSWVVVTAVPYSFISGAITAAIVKTSLVGLVLLALLALFMYIVISKYLNPVTKVTAEIKSITDGDFTATIIPEGNNEITTLNEQLNGYIENMRRMLHTLTDISGKMNERAGECTDISGALASANRNQNQSLEQLNNILGDMNRTIDEVAGAATSLATTASELSDNATEVREFCQEAVKSSGSGKNEMEGMTESMSVLNKTFTELTDIIHMTGETVNEISGITETINAISAQTNLLSLNASIEAARAGELGRGFAVVANEVGALAGQSSEATDSIKSLVDNITKNIGEINARADRCLKDMAECMSGVERVNESFGLIYEDISKASDGITQITEGIDHISEYAHTNAAITQEQSATITQILSLSDQLVQESETISEETDSITDISGKLNEYAGNIADDLKYYTL